MKPSVITRVCAIALLALAVAFGASAQTTAAPENFVAACAAWNGTSGNGCVSVGKSLGSGLYSFTTYDVSIASRKPLTFQYSARTGVAFDLTTLAPSLSFGGRLHLFEIADAGAAANANAFGFATSPLGGFGAFDLGAKIRHVHFLAGARWLKTTASSGTVIEIGVAYPF